MFTSTELTDMQAEQVNHMMDLAVIQIYSASVDGYGEPVGSWVDSVTTTVCGFDPSGGREMIMPDKTVLKTDAVIRLPIATVIDPKDRIKITKRFNVAITNEVYQVVGNVQRGPSGLVVDVQRVQV
jgi:hypothetical protein